MKLIKFRSASMIYNKRSEKYYQTSKLTVTEIRILKHFTENTLAENVFMISEPFFLSL